MTLPHSGTWYLVFWNDDTVTSKHNEGDTYYSAPSSASPAGVGTVVIVVLGIFGFIGIIGGLHYFFNVVGKDEEKVSAERPPQQSASGPRFCPYCGAKIESRTAKFCQECGASLEPPPGIE
ncbi:MAG: zinc-ribbon domain-containing protein [Candidatus Thorarchaeota archaeon]